MGLGTPLQQAVWLFLGRKPVAAIHGLRYALGMRDFKYSGISSGGLVVYFYRPGDLRIEVRDNTSHWLKLKLSTLS